MPLTFPFSSLSISANALSIRNFLVAWKKPFNPRQGHRRCQCLTHLLRNLVLDQLEHVLDQPLQLPFGDVPVAVHVKHTENPPQSLFCCAVGHDVEDQLEYMEHQVDGPARIYGNDVFVEQYVVMLPWTRQSQCSHSRSRRSIGRCASACRLRLVQAASEQR